MRREARLREKRWEREMGEMSHIGRMEKKMKELEKSRTAGGEEGRREDKERVKDLGDKVKEKNLGIK